MSRKAVSVGLGLAILFQLLVMAGGYLSAAAPLWLGQEIKIKTVPVDPRSLFRGNYARLRYDISQIRADAFADSNRAANLRNGEVVYVSLKPGADGLYEFAGAALEEPADGVFLRGRVANRRYENNATYYRVAYGIEAFFAPKAKAIELERGLADGGVAILMVTAGGKAALREVLPAD